MLQDIALPSLAKTGLTDFLQHNRAVNGLLGGGQSTPVQKSVGSSVPDQCLDAACGRQEPFPCESPTRLQVLEAYGKLNPSH